MGVVTMFCITAHYNDVVCMPASLLSLLTMVSTPHSGTFL